MSWLAAAAKARLGDVGVVGLRLGAGERLVEARQLFGALTNAPLQRLVRALALLLATASVTSV